jgi:hypothetical protein
MARDTNFLPGRKGKLSLRGPIAHFKNLPGGVTTTANNWFTCGGWAFDDKVLINDSGSNFYVADFANPASPTLSAVAARPASVTPGQMGVVARLGSYVYGTNYGNYVVRWDGGSITASLVQITNGPKDPISVAVHLDRLFALGGSVPGTASPAFADRLYWTDPAWDGTDTLAKWQDDVSGLVNQIEFGDPSNRPVALVPFQGKLLIFRRNSIDALTGLSPANFVVKTVAHLGSAKIGNDQTIVVHDDGVFFASSKGYSMYDGTGVRSVSAPVETSDFWTTQLTNNLATQACLLDNDHILVINFTLGFFAVLHIPTLSWIKVDLSAYNHATAFTTLGRTQNYPFIAGNATVSVGRIALLEYLTQPDSALAAGVSFQDYGATAYGGTVRSRIVQLATPEAKAQLQHRMNRDNPQPRL